MIEYKKILRDNMLNVLKDILRHIVNKGLSNNNHLYITFLTDYFKNKIPSWIQEKYPKEMTIVIQHEYYDLKINKNDFLITLSFNDINAVLKINYESIISFADPSANFGLRLEEGKTQIKSNKSIKKQKTKNNIINFSNYKKN
ncbi:ClpXP protease specificity-enhancing factor SspB [Pelagibacteraceae bacterium]|nr:ClpXP protease specificity-enhancing factor SspB [Pelagibacteraceae bacterium]